jgi:hypothetical protein
MQRLRDQGGMKGGIPAVPAVGLGDLSGGRAAQNAPMAARFVGTTKLED